MYSVYGYYVLLILIEGNMNRVLDWNDYSVESAS